MSNKGDPFEVAKKIRTGELVGELPDYEIINSWLQRVPKTWIPGILAQVVYSAVAEDVFVTGGLVQFVAAKERDARNPASILR